MEFDHRTVVHTETYVSADGIHTDQVECLWSLLLPWIRKFRGLSRPGLEQAARTYGFFSLTESRSRTNSVAHRLRINQHLRQFE